MVRKNHMSIIIKTMLCLLFVIQLQHMAYSGITADSKPKIFLEFSTRRTPINLKKSKIWVDKVDVTEYAEITQVDISYIPRENLEPGQHDVTVLLVDKNGEEKRHHWSFKIDPNAKVKDFKIDFFEPMPENGAIVTKNKIRGAIDISNLKNANEYSFEFYLAKDTKGFRRMTPPIKISSETLSFEFNNLEEGTKTLLVICKDKHNNSKQIQSSFTVDTVAPSIENILTQSGYLTGKDIVVEASFNDAPYHSAQRMLLDIIGPQGKSISLKAENVYQKHRFSFPAKEVNKWPPGLYKIEITVWDYAGHKSKNQFPKYIQIYESNNELISKHITLDPYPRYTNEFQINISGKANAQSQVVLYVNEQKFSTIKTGPLIFKGNFNFKKVSLEEGFNQLHFQILALDGSEITKKLNAAGILVDRTPPKLMYRFPEDDESLVSPHPEIQFSLYDPGEEKQSFEKMDIKGSGIKENSVSVSINNKKAKAFKSSGRYQVEFADDLKVGKHTLSISASDLLNNKITFNSSFTITRGPLSTFDASIDKKVVYTQGGDSSVITISVLDAYGRPAIDGSIIYLKTSKGTITEKIPVFNGEAKVHFIPPIKPGKAIITVYHPSLKRKVKFNLDCLEPPNRIPHSLKIRQSKPSLKADGGKSSIKFTASLYDAWDRPVSDGLAINLKTSLGKLDENQKIVEKGTVNFTLFSGTKTGDATIKISHQQFKHSFRVPITTPPLGKTKIIKVDLRPKYLVAGSMLPQRITVRCYDAYDRIVRDGTLVKFSIDKGKIVPSGRTYKGKVLNNYQAPKETGIVKLTISSDGESKEIPIEIVESQSFMKTEKIWIKKFKAPPVEGMVKVQGQLFGNREQVIKGSKAIFVHSNNSKAPKFVVARDGLFEIDLKDCKAGKITIELRSDEVSQSFSFTCVKETIQIKKEVEEVIQNKLNAILDIRFQQTRQSGTLNTGFLYFKIIALENNKMPLKELDGKLIHIKSNEGKVASKVFLINGEARLPYSYESNHSKDITINASLENTIKDTLVIHPTYQAVVEEETIQFTAKLFYKIQNKGLLLTFTQSQGIPPESTVTFSSTLNSKLAFKKHVILGDTASVFYPIPDKGSSDTITAQCGSYNKTLELNLDLIRPQINKDQIDLISKVEDKRELNIDTGLQLILLSGKTRLQAGGRDRTRLRFRLLDNKNNNLSDGTEVECVFTQGKITPFRTKVKRGLITINLQTSNWVGRYPFIVRVGNITKKINIDLVAPDINAPNLPGFPDSPRNKFRRRR